MSHPSKKSAIALWHRYGPGGHTACGGHAIPLVVEELAKTYDVHYFGMHSVEPTPPKIAANARLHLLPFTFHRASTHDKLVKTLIWYAAMPFMALYCRFKGVKLIFIDETLPLLAPIVLMFYGRSMAITIMDFFLDIYFEEARLMRPLIRLIKAWDVWAWRRIPVIFTKVDYTHQYLTKVGVPADRIHTIRNPCDFSIFHPMDKAAARLRFGIPQDELVMVHHGILHPNKNNDLPIRALAELRADVPNLRFLLIGDGPEMPRLKALAAELGVTDRVTFTGWLPDEATLNEALNTADIGLVLRIGQYWDNFHMTETLAHEMAVGLPILASDLKGIAEVVTPTEGGLLFAAGDLRDFELNLRTMLRDASERARLSAGSGRAVSRCCDVRSVAASITGSLREASEKNLVAIVVPVYKNDLAPMERTSLDRCVQVLGRYPLFLLHPEGLDVTPLTRDWPAFRTISFPSNYFTSQMAYSRLCTRPEFYAAFADYTYMLIYQTDCYVFDDQLAYWCAQGYDYIGAPWLNYEHQTQSLSRWIRSPLLRPFLRRVGNGGFSLRKVRTFRRAARWLAPLAFLMKGIPEDVFWCNVANRLWPLRIAGVDDALRFAFDTNPALCLARTRGALPFGCHAWNTVNVDFWLPRIGIGAGASSAK